MGSQNLVTVTFADDTSLPFIVNRKDSYFIESDETMRANDANIGKPIFASSATNNLLPNPKNKTNGGSSHR